MLITGGSQGSRTLNRAAEESWPLLEAGEDRPVDPSDRRGRIRRDRRAVSSRRAWTARSWRSSRYAGGFAEADLVVSRSGRDGERACRRGKAVDPGSAADGERSASTAQCRSVRTGRARPGCCSIRRLTGARLVEEIERVFASEAGTNGRRRRAALAHPGAAGARRKFWNRFRFRDRH